MRIQEIYAFAILSTLCGVWGCDTTADRSGSPPALPAGSGDVNIRTPGTPGANDPDDVNIDIDVNRDEVPAVSSTPRSSTPLERRQERRERLGEAIDRIDVQVDANGADVNVD